MQAELRERRDIVATDSNGYREQKSRATFDETVGRLIVAIEKAGMTIFAKIDHAAGAKKVGISMPPTVVLLYGHARGGTPVMLAAPEAALDLPLRVLIRQTEQGDTVVALHSIEQMLAPYAVGAELVERLAKAQQVIFASI
jgi:uncharacterized protein (DUF302 family)